MRNKLKANLTCSRSCNGNILMAEEKNTRWVNLASRRTAGVRASDRANAARWNLNIAVFSFALMIVIIVLSCSLPKVVPVQELNQMKHYPLFAPMYISLPDKG